jgi:dsDNA-specific endonuclease/ATPase MutS2
MDEPPQVVDVDDPDDQQSETKGLAQQEASQVAQDTRDQAKEVAESARSGAAEVVEEAKHQASDLIADARTQLHGQARQQTDQLGRAIQGLGDRLHAVAEGRPDEAGQVTDYTDRLAYQVEQLGSRVSELGFDGTIEELQRFARRRPGMFLLGAAGAGFVTARLGRGAKDAQDGHESSSDTSLPGERP